MVSMAVTIGGKEAGTLIVEVIFMTNQKLYDDICPVTVEKFKSTIKGSSGFSYDGAKCDRLIAKGWMQIGILILTQIATNRLVLKSLTMYLLVLPLFKAR